MSPDRNFGAKATLIIILEGFLWMISGFIAGYYPFDIHEWGMVWISATVFVLPVVVVVSIIAAIVVPKLASKRKYAHPQLLALIVVSLWFLVTFIVTLFILVLMGLKCGYLTFDC